MKLTQTRSPEGHLKSLELVCEDAEEKILLAEGFADRLTLTLVNNCGHYTLDTTLRRQIRFMLLKKMTPFPVWNGEFYRACGDVECSGCGYSYDLHPSEFGQNSWLNILCNGDRVKL